MKKIILPLLAVAVLAFSSCDALKDATEVDITSTFKTDIPLVTTGSEFVGINTKSVTMEYDFGGSGSITIADQDKNVEKILSGIRKITMQNPGIAFQGLTGDENILEVTITLTTNKKDFVVLEATNLNVQKLMDNGSLAYQLLNATEVSGFLTEWKETDFDTFLIDVDGKSDFLMTPDKVTAKLKLPSTITYSPIE